MATDPNLAPETHNSEQDDEDSQAQTVADQANALRKGDPTSSEKVGGGDTQDEAPSGRFIPLLSLMTSGLAALTLLIQTGAALVLPPCFG